MNECPKAPDALLLRMGELDFWSAQKARLHLLTCAECRRESELLLRSALQLQLTLARPRSIAPRARHVSFTLVAKAAALVAISSGLVYAARVSVDAAIAQLNQPRTRNASYNETADQLPNRRHPN